ncbi:helix-turn-helix domain-containing protein [Proteus vulgaris]|uniref:Helix-turn-helix transcriptional regulator n=2 Tax=Proteus terrae TaxID=1574161 RepID=A0A8I0WRF4_9GAMM|nr:MULTISPECIES: XRE family transcriptional regulator [Proteus]MBG2915143.1 helix-turn-helix transcriptional regulator [Proteus terrae subsp. cibarius]UPK82510.1 helix-turn-helix domain-containing protein [Proteus vulgaris]
MNRKISESDKIAAQNLRNIWESKRESLGLTQEKAADIMGFATQGAVSQYLNGRTALNTDTILKFASLLRVDPEDINPELKILLDYVRKTRKEEETKQPMPSTQNEHTTLKLMDVYAKAGPGGFINNDFPDTIKSIEFSPEKVFELFGRKSLKGIEIINISGDSMSPAINPRDVVFVDTHNEFFDGDGVYIFSFENSLFIKRLQRVKGRKLAVKSDNPAYETFYIEESEMYDLRIIGKVIKSLPIRMIDFA